VPRGREPVKGRVGGWHGSCSAVTCRQRRFAGRPGCVAHNRRAGRGGLRTPPFSARAPLRTGGQQRKGDAGDLARVTRQRGVVEEYGAKARRRRRLSRIEAREARPDVGIQDWDADAAATLDARRRRCDRERQQQKGEEPQQRAHGNASQESSTLGHDFSGLASSVAMRCCSVLAAHAQEFLMPGNNVISTNGADRVVRPKRPPEIARRSTRSGLSMVVNIRTTSKGET